MPVAAVDISDPAKAERELAEANARLAREAEVPAAVRGLVRDFAEGLADPAEPDWAHVDPYLVLALQQAAMGALLALSCDDPREERRRLRLRLEQMRQVFRDLAAGQPVDERRPADEVARWLVQTLDVPQSRLAPLLGVGGRTLQRWVSESDATRPSGEDERRLRVVARLANQLRHGLTGRGVAAWFERPRIELEGRTPAELLGDEQAFPRLATLASSARSSLAA
jgi:DNA-binding transcriptional regulator YiaG